MEKQSGGAEENHLILIPENLIQEESVCLIADTEQVLLAQSQQPETTDNVPEPVTDTDVHEGAKQKKTFFQKIPYFIILVSAIQVIIHFTGGKNLPMLFCYDPHRRHEIWRFFTGMLVHDDNEHLYGNLEYQLLFGIPFEINHYWKHTGIIYLAGELGGNLCITVWDQQRYSLGASAAIYALIVSCVSTLIVNRKNLHCTHYCLLVFLGFYIIIEARTKFFSDAKELQPETKSVSHAGHFGGAVFGVLVSIVLLNKRQRQGLAKAIVITCKVIIIALTAFTIFVNTYFPSHYLKSEFNLDYMGSYESFVNETSEESMEETDLTSNDTRNVK